MRLRSRKLGVCGLGPTTHRRRRELSAGGMSAGAPPPCATSANIGSASDLAACRALIRSGSRSFFAASVLLPARVREPAFGLYAFCRLADDAVDCGKAESRLDQLRDRLDGIYNGIPANIAADRAFAQA